MSQRVPAVIPLLSIDEAQPDRIGGIDAPIAQERPGDAGLRDLAQVQSGDDYGLLVDTGGGEDALTCEPATVLPMAQRYFLF